MSTLCRSLFTNIYKLGSLLKFGGTRNLCEAVLPSATMEESRKRKLYVEYSDVKKPQLEVDRVKRKKVAILLAYSGQGYYGMQRNPETKTIEEDLLCAMLKAGFLTEDAFSIPQTIQFQRAARTDKGVSAARQVISLKLR